MKARVKSTGELLEVRHKDTGTEYSYVCDMQGECGTMWKESQLEFLDMEKGLLNTFDKELLLKDLCARLPYGVKVEIIHWRNRDKGIIDRKLFCFPLDVNKANILVKTTLDIRPYLFPLSSMTDEQKKEYQYITEIWMYDPSYSISDSTDWLDKNHFDYRGLIEKGLAIDATGKDIY